MIRPYGDKAPRHHEAVKLQEAPKEVNYTISSKIQVQRARNFKDCPWHDDPPHVVLKKLRKMARLCRPLLLEAEQELRMYGIFHITDDGSHLPILMKALKRLHRWFHWEVTDIEKGIVKLERRMEEEWNGTRLSRGWRRHKMPSKSSKESYEAIDGPSAPESSRIPEYERRRKRRDVRGEHPNGTPEAVNAAPYQGGSHHRRGRKRRSRAEAHREGSEVLEAMDAVASLEKRHIQSKTDPEEPRSERVSQPSIRVMPVARDQHDPESVMAQSEAKWKPEFSFSEVEKMNQSRHSSSEPTMPKPWNSHRGHLNTIGGQQKVVVTPKIPSISGHSQQRPTENKHENHAENLVDDLGTQQGETATPSVTTNPTQADYRSRRTKGPEASLVDSPEDQQKSSTKPNVFSVAGNVIRRSVGMSGPPVSSSSSEILGEKTEPLLKESKAKSVVELSRSRNINAASPSQGHRGHETQHHQSISALSSKVSTRSFAGRLLQTPRPAPESHTRSTASATNLAKSQPSIVSTKSNLKQTKGNPKHEVEQATLTRNATVSDPGPKPDQSSSAHLVPSNHKSSKSKPVKSAEKRDTSPFVPDIKTTASEPETYNVPQLLRMKRGISRPRQVESPPNRGTDAVRSNMGTAAPDAGLKHTNHDLAQLLGMKRGRRANDLPNSKPGPSLPNIHPTGPQRLDAGHVLAHDDFNTRPPPQPQPWSFEGV